MNEELTEKRLNKLMAKFDEVNQLYIKLIADQINTLGKMNPTSVHRIEVMAQMNADIAAINLALAEATRRSVTEVYQLYNEVLNDEYTDERFERALTKAPLSDDALDRLNRYAQTVSMQTAGTMMNLSNTTLASQTYINTIDNAIISVSSGMTDYKSAIRESIKQLGHEGIQVQYPSGVRRRLDTVVRQHVLDGARQLSQTASLALGEELGYDAVEISAHPFSAPDHEPVQGRVILKEEFEKMQAGEDFVSTSGHAYGGFGRPIGAWNCRHLVMSFSTKYSTPKYSEQQLNEYAKQNADGCEIDGRHYTIYKASQYMRKLETAIRREKDTAIAAQLTGDDVLRRECQIKINTLGARYMNVSKASGLRPKVENLEVRGFKTMKL